MVDNDHVRVERPKRRGARAPDFQGRDREKAERGRGTPDPVLDEADEGAD